MVGKNNIQRVLRYKHCISNFYELGFDKIYSHNLAKELGVSPEQVRKDFSEFGIRGNKRAGYDIHQLIDTFQNIFHSKINKHTILVGMGNIGNALTRYRGFKRKKLSIIAAFDIDPHKIKGKSSIPVYDFSEAPSFIKNNCIYTAILSVPVISAQNVTDVLVESGIIGILNFAPTILKVPDKVVVNNIDLSLELESLFYISRSSVKMRKECKENEEK